MSESIDLDDGYEPDDYDDRADEQPEPEPARRKQPKGRRPKRDDSRIPARAPRPQDHRPASTPVIRGEAEGIETVTVEFDGESYTIPADPADWPINATEAFENGRAVTAIRMLLAPDEWIKVQRKQYRNRQFRELFDALARAGGFRNSGN
ncbi:hypothetical protein [Skermania piniformis]|uniref:Tail assembly chaperone n=1 Tax=Skermania pinensis TaxID=39122 RepID=A0ABX8SDZ2_9ACTN|nr:hypothetical protein [Skermania piniformis]QXQ14840.1 hypothetical protein KV203_05515 [Skermania piniformis]